MTSSDKALPINISEGDSLAVAGQNFQSLKRDPRPLLEEHPYCPKTLAAQVEAEVIELFRLHVGALSRYAATVTRDSGILQDGIQEAFLRYFTTRIGGQQVENPRAWLFRVLRNYIIDRHRKSNPLREVGLAAAGHLVDFRQDVEAKYGQSEVFQHAFSSLSPRERECMRLRLEGFGYEEIAHVLQIRSGTVGALLARGLKKIRDTKPLSGRQ